MFLFLINACKRFAFYKAILYLNGINGIKVLTMLMVSAFMLFTVKKKKRCLFNTLCCYSCTLKNIIFKVNVIQNKLCDEELYNSHVFEISIIMLAWACIACLVKLLQSLIIGTKKSIPRSPQKNNTINNKQRTIYEN